MDPELQKRIDAAKAAGYSDEEIQQVLGSDTSKSAQPEATMPNGYNVPILSAEEKAKFQQSQQAIEAANSGQNLETGLVTAGMGAAAVGVPLAIYKGAQRILSPGVQSGAELAQRGVGAMESANEIARQTEQRIAAKQAGKLGPVVPGPGTMAGATPTAAMGPVNPATQPASMTSRVQAAAANNIKNLPPATMMGNVGKMAGRVLPGAGTVLNAYDAYDRAKQGDYLGAGIAGVGAAASPLPVLGTAVGMGTGAINAYRDYLKRQEEEKKRMMQQ
jgi:hypothetical protein